jgi:uncharacterized membrane protein
MATLSVLKFNDPYGADRVLLALNGLQQRQIINLEDAAVVSRPQVLLRLLPYQSLGGK